jgi:hypothetical protein
MWDTELVCFWKSSFQKAYMCHVCSFARGYWVFLFFKKGPLGGGEALYYNSEGRGFETRWGEWIFFNLPNPSSRTRPWGLLIFLESRERPVRRADNLTVICEWSQSQSYFMTDGQAVNQYVLVSSPLWNLWPDITSCLKVSVRKLLSCLYGAPSLRRGCVCSLHFNHSVVRVTQNL